MAYRLTLPERSFAFALEKHAGQTRPNRAQEPKAIHIAEVTSLVRDSGGSDPEIASASLHDTIEDTDTTLREIYDLFGEAITDTVDGLTDAMDLEGLAIFPRKQLQANRVSGKSSSVKRCKLADSISNVRSVATDPPVGWGPQDCLDYIEGCRLVALACAGVSDYLDQLFTQAYTQARDVWIVA